MSTNLAIHKEAAYIHNCIKPPISKFKKTSINNSTSKNNNELISSTADIEENTLVSTLNAANGDLVKASKILDMKLEATNDLIKELSDNYSKLSDVEFYNRLNMLKMEHKKTLSMCETLYNIQQKNAELSLEPKPANMCLKTNDKQEKVDATVLARRRVKELEQRLSKSNGAHDAIDKFDLSDSFGKDYLVAGSKKPPVAATRPQPSAAEPNKKETLESGDSIPPRSRVGWSEAPKDFYAPANLPSHRIRHSSADSPFWKPGSTGSNSDDDNLENYLLGDKTNAQRRVRDLWHDFQVEDYDSQIQGESVRRSASLDGRDHLTNKNRHNNTFLSKSSDRWRHRITIPQPFSMSTRDENKSLRKSRSMIAFERDRMERQKAEEAELTKRFSANPVPAHVYVPLLDELFEKQESKRQFIKAYKKELTLSSQKPFNFTKREEERRRQQQLLASSTCDAGQPTQSKQGEREKTIHKPVKLPASTFEDRTRRLQEDEIYRQVKSKMRAERLLKSASEPVGMKERQEEALAKKRLEAERKLQQQRKREKFRPRTRDIPDYAALQRSFEQSLRHTKSANSVPIRQKPFRLRTEERSEVKRVKSNGQTSTTMADNVHRTTSTQAWDYALRASQEVPPSACTNASVLRENRTREWQYSEKARQRDAENAERVRLQRKAELQRSLRESMEFGPSKSVDAITQERLMQLRKSNLEREKEYQQQLQEMEDKIRNKPLLIEEEAKYMAKLRAERKYKQTLKNENLNEEFVDQKARAYQKSDVYGYDEKYDEFDSEGSQSNEDSGNENGLIEDVGADYLAD